MPLIPNFKRPIDKARYERDIDILRGNHVYPLEYYIEKELQKNKYEENLKKKYPEAFENYKK